MPPEIDRLLSRYSPSVQAIALTLRAMAKKALPLAHEFVYHRAINYSLPESSFDRVCYLAPQKSYVNLGFFFGAHLPDPQNLPLGEEKRMRQEKVTSVEEAENPSLEDLVKAAWHDAPSSIANLSCQAYSDTMPTA